MKSTLVRLSVLALTFAGFTASSIVSSASVKPVVKSKIQCVGGSTPLCGPRIPTCGGMD